MNEFAKALQLKATALENERAELTAQLRASEQRLRDIKSALSGIEMLLRLEGIQPSSVALEGSNGADNPPPELYTVLTEALLDRQPHTLSELVLSAKARGVDFGEKSPGKTVNFTLLGISRGKKVQRMDDGRWRLAPGTEESRCADEQDSRPHGQL